MPHNPRRRREGDEGDGSDDDDKEDPPSPPPPPPPPPNSEEVVHSTDILVTLLNNVHSDHLSGLVKVCECDEPSESALKQSPRSVLPM